MVSRQFCLLAILVLAMGMPTAVYASQAQQQAPSQYYQSTLAVVMVNLVTSTSVSLIHQFAFAINPSQIPAGTSFVIQFRVVYPVGTSPSGYPVTLAPSIASFSFTNNLGDSYLLTQVQVNPVPNQPGNYTYASTITPDFPQGVVTAAVLAGSLQDTEGNIGPSGTIASHNSVAPLDQTPSLYDNSILTIGAAQVTPPSSVTAINNLPPLTFPSIILALILLALVLQVKVRHRKARTKKD